MRPSELSTGATGVWPASTSVGGFLGTGYQSHAAGTGTSVFTWTATLAQAGSFAVYARWTAHANRATNATYRVQTAAGLIPVAVNQRVNGGAWQLLGTYAFNAGSIGDRGGGNSSRNLDQNLSVGTVLSLVRCGRDLASFYRAMEGTAEARSSILNLLEDGPLVRQSSPP